MKNYLSKASELIGKELDFTELDREMVSRRFHTELCSGLDFDEIATGGCIFYNVNATDESECCNVDDRVKIKFEVTANHGDDEDASATYIKITDIEEA